MFNTLANWLRCHGRQAFLTETGGGNTQSCVQYICQQMQFLKANSDVYVGYSTSCGHLTCLLADHVHSQPDGRLEVTIVSRLRLRVIGCPVADSFLPPSYLRLGRDSSQHPAVDRYVTHCELYVLVRPNGYGAWSAVSEIKMSLEPQHDHAFFLGIAFSYTSQYPSTGVIHATGVRTFRSSFSNTSRCHQSYGTLCCMVALSIRE